MTLRLHTYWASSAAYRVRIALNLKGLAYESAFVSLTKDGGDHRQADYLAINPHGLVPALETPHGTLTQSMAILEYLEEAHPGPALLPHDLAARARVRAFALAIACDIHPVNNLRIRKYLAGELGQGEDAVLVWYRHWIATGFAALERDLSTQDGRFCFGPAPTFADICLVPQVYNARRFGVDLGPYPRLVAADAAASSLEAFAAAAPERQADAPKA